MMGQIIRLFAPLFGYLVIDFTASISCNSCAFDALDLINAQSASLRSFIAAESRAEQRADSPARNRQLAKTPQAEISGRRKLLRPKSPDENSSGRSLWKVFLNFFCHFSCCLRSEVENV